MIKNLQLLQILSAKALPVLSTILVLTLLACAAPAPDRMPTQVDTENLVEEYRIGVGDMVEVSVWRNPDLGATVPVRPDGQISVPLIGDVDAGGKTAEEVAEIIRKELEVYVKQPRVAVILTQLNSHEFLSRIRVTGAVRNPVTIPYRRGITVLDAVLEAGGLNEFASPDRARLVRKSGDEPGTYGISLGEILNKGDLTTNYELRPGDVITVPERTL